MKKAENKFDKSNVILSECAGLQIHIGGAMIVNPYNIEDITKNIDCALQMLPEEREQRLELAYSYIHNNSTQKWATGFIKDLKQNPEDVVGNDTRNKFVGFNLQSTLIRTQNQFRELNSDRVAENFMKAKNKLILINQEGVLPLIQKAPSASIKESLRILSQQHNCHVMVISSHQKEVLLNWFGKSAPKLGLAAENGYFYRWPTGKEGEETKWDLLLDEVGDNHWIQSVRDIMANYSAKTDGSSIEERESMVIWNFKDSDPEFGTWQAKELKRHLETFFSVLLLKIVECKKSV